jgi:hypothetical protein
VSKTSLTGEPLTVRSLSSALTRTASYQMMICAIKHADYLLRDGKLGLRHLAGCHGELAVLDRAKAADVAGNRHTVGRIGEHHLRPGVAEHC